MPSSVSASIPPEWIVLPAHPTLEVVRDSYSLVGLFVLHYLPGPPWIRF